MPEPEEMQRFDALLEAMVNKPPLKADTAIDDEEDNGGADLREAD